jgi:thioredoxin reductase (NADPH)
VWNIEPLSKLSRPIKRLVVAKHYQLIIVGGGPAGLSAGLYAIRAGINALLIEKGILGGQITNAELVENYPGFPEGISGFELGRLMAEQAMKFGLETLNAEVLGVRVSGQDKMVNTSAGDYVAQALILASGSDYIKLDVPGGELMGKGVSYCATCDGPLFRDRVVAIVGGGDAAITEALFLSKFAAKVSVIHRRDQLRAVKALQERAFADHKIDFVWDTIVESIVGNDRVRELKLRNVKTGEKSSLEVDGVFIAVGLRPNTGYVKEFLGLTPEGFIPVNDSMETEIPGVFAAGDIRYNSIMQVVTATADGAVAALSADRYLSEQR